MSMQRVTRPAGHVAMDERTVERVDTAIHLTALLVRAGVYGCVGAFAGRYDCGHAVLTGLLAGDLAASLVGLALHPRQFAQLLAELALLGLICLWVRADLVWPTLPAHRAIAGLAAFGVFASRAGGSVLTRLGPSENGFA